MHRHRHSLSSSCFALHDLGPACLSLRLRVVHPNSTAFRIIRPDSSGNLYVYLSNVDAHLFINATTCTPRSEILLAKSDVNSVLNLSILQRFREPLLGVPTCTLRHAMSTLLLSRLGIPRETAAWGLAILI